MDLVVAYDIKTETPAGQRRLSRVAAVCSRYGERVQLSLFECRLDEVRTRMLLNELADTIDSDEDSVCMYLLPQGFDHCRRRLGRPSSHDVGAPWLL